jgi:hypothetical protein
VLKTRPTSAGLTSSPQRLPETRVGPNKAPVPRAGSLQGPHPPHQETVSVHRVDHPLIRLSGAPGKATKNGLRQPARRGLYSRTHGEQPSAYRPFVPASLGIACVCEYVGTYALHESVCSLVVAFTWVEDARKL